MGDRDFQDEIFKRLAKLEQSQTRIETLLSERCSVCFARIGSVEQSQVRQGERIGILESREQQRKGGMAVIAAVGAVAGSIGAFLVKLWTGGQ